MGKESFFHTAYKHRFELETLRRMYGHQCHAALVAAIKLILVACKRGVGEKRGNTLFAQRLIVPRSNRREFFDILETLAIVFTTLEQRCAHATLLDDELHKFRWAQIIRHLR